MTFTVGIPSLLSRRFPRDRYVAGFCRHKFAGALCKYVQPSHSRESFLIAFVPGVDTGVEDVRYNTITVGNGTLVSAVFDYAPGIWSCPGNLTTNGSFEVGVVGDRDGWTTDFRDSGYPTRWDLWGSATRRWAWGGSKYDRRSVGIDSSDINGGVSQTISVVSGTTYTISCWVYTISTTSVRMMTRIDGVHLSKYATADVGWEKMTRTVTPTEDQLTIWLGGEGEAWFDAVCMVEGAVAGEYDQFALEENTGFTISGSLYNDGFFLANSYHGVGEKYVRVFMEVDGAKAFVAEPAGERVTIQLGYNICDHTLKACGLRDNTQNYGGSPGIVGGMYG